MTTGYVPGGFDLFHIGHLNMLLAARERCDVLIAGVATDASLEQMKGRLPVVPYEERVEIVAAMRCVDTVVADASVDKRIAWDLVQFDVLFKGSDWLGTEKGDRLEAQLQEVGARIVYLPYTARTSSSALRAFITA